MDETNFHERADALLASLSEAFEIADTEGTVTIEHSDDGLIIELDDGEYSITKKEADLQIRMSSPESGVSRFDYSDDEDEWRDAEGETFQEKISDELARVAGINVEF